MPTVRVPAFRCDTDWLGWLVGTDPAMEDGEVHRTVCFSNFNNGCKYSESIKEVSQFQYFKVLNQCPETE